MKKPEARIVLDTPPVKMMILSGILVALVVITHSLIVPFEEVVLGNPLGAGVLFYLPFGFWVIVAYFERWQAALYLAPGFAIGVILYGNSGVPVATHVLTLAVLTMSAPLVFAILAWTAGRKNYPVDEPVAWRLIVTAGLVTALVNAIGLHLVRQPVLPDSATLTGVLHYVAGSMVGLVTCLFGLAIAFRIREHILKLR